MNVVPLPTNKSLSIISPFPSLVAAASFLFFPPPVFRRRRAIKVFFPGEHLSSRVNGALGARRENKGSFLSCFPICKASSPCPNAEDSFRESIHYFSHIFLRSISIRTIGFSLDLPLLAWPHFFPSVISF